MKKRISLCYLLFCICFLTYGDVGGAIEHTTGRTSPLVDCSRIERYECVITDDGRKTYEFEIVFCDGVGVTLFESVSSQHGAIYDWKYTPRPAPAPFGEYLITGIFEPAIGVDSFCIDIVYSDGVLINPQTSEIRLCGSIPECPCMISNEVVERPECIRPGEMFRIQYSFDFCGDSDLTLEWEVDGIGFSIVSCSNGDDNVVQIGPNIWEICLIYKGDCPNPNNLPFVLNGTIGNTACELQFNTSFRCCHCIPLTTELTLGDCTTEGDIRFYEYSILVQAGVDIDSGFTLSTRSGSLVPSDPPVIPTPDGDVLISGILRIYAAVPGEVCITIEAENSIYCPIEDICFDLPPCCERVNTSNPTMSCEIGENRREYKFSFEIERLQNRSFPYTISTDCGNISLDPPGINATSFIVNGTLSDLQIGSGEECCFNIDYHNNGLCDGEICIEIPECEGCYDHLVVDAPDCLDSSGQHFCITYTFDYFGPPTTGVSVLWYSLLSTSSYIKSLSPTNRTPGASGDEVIVGTNVWELCFDYTPGEGGCEGPIPLGVSAVMLTDKGLHCCSFTDERELECCCIPPIDFQWCGIEAEQLRLIRQSLGSEAADLNPIMDGITGCLNSCCRICDIGKGPILAIDASTQTRFSDSLYTFQWEGGTINGQTNNYIFGEPGVTYTVTVTNEENCSRVASITVDCMEGEGQLKQDRSLIQWQDESLEDLLIFPNPTSDQLRLNGSMIREGVQVQLINLTGQQVFAKEVQGQGQISINTLELPAGTYFVQLQDAKGQLLTNQRVVIMH